MTKREGKRMLEGMLGMIIIWFVCVWFWLVISTCVYENVWDTLIAGVTTLWDEFVYCIRAIPGIHTPFPAWPSSQQSNTDLLALAKAIEDEINDVDIDYEQPQSMYPELPYEEVTE